MDGLQCLDSLAITYDELGCEPTILLPEDLQDLSFKERFGGLYDGIKKDLVTFNKLKANLKHWLELLSQDGKNTKLQVKNEIKVVLEGMEE